MEEKRESWDCKKGERVETPQKQIDFIEEIDAVCKKYNLSISHEDGHGGFEIEEYDPYNIEWLKRAGINWE